MPNYLKATIKHLTGRKLNASVIHSLEPYEDWVEIKNNVIHLYIPLKPYSVELIEKIATLQEHLTLSYSSDCDFHEKRSVYVNYQEKWIQVITYEVKVMP